MKYLLLVLLALLAFNGTYSQLPGPDTTADIDLAAEFEEQPEEENASGVDEVVVEEERERESEVDVERPEEESETMVDDEVIEIEDEIIEELNQDEVDEILEVFVEEELQPDASGNANVSISKFLSTDFHKKILNFVVQWQLFVLEGYALIPDYYAWQLDKTNFIQFNKNEGVWRINNRIHDVEISRDFFTGHSVLEIGENPQRINILRTKWGINSEVAVPFTQADWDKIATGWSYIDPKAGQEDPAFVELLDYAVDLTAEIAPTRVLPQGEWSLKELTGCSIQERANGNIYHLNVIMAGPDGYTAKGEIAVLKRPDGSKNFINYGFDGLYPPTA